MPHCVQFRDARQVVVVFVGDDHSIRGQPLAMASGCARPRSPPPVRPSSRCQSSDQCLACPFASWLRRVWRTFIPHPRQRRNQGIVAPVRLLLSRSFGILFRSCASGRSPRPWLSSAVITVPSALTSNRRGPYGSFDSSEFESVPRQGWGTHCFAPALHGPRLCAR